MPRPTGPRKDLSAVKGNPTSAIQDNYQQLMAVQDPEELKQLFLRIVTPYRGRSLSEINYRKIINTLQNLDDVLGLQRYISNYMLSGSGMAVGESQIEAVASLLNEDGEVIDLTEEQYVVKQLVESYGFPVRVL